MSGKPGLRWFVLVALLISLLGLTASAQDRPYAFYLLIDTSASMTETPRAPKVPEDWKESKLEAVRRELGRFCSSLPTEAEVVIYTFDVELREGPKVAILSTEDRDQLREYFAELDAKGKQTHLWRSLAVVLEKASQAVQATPGKMVRVLVYTDGEDTDPNSPGPEPVLQPYKGLLEDGGRLTFVTLGYTLRSDYQKAIEDAGGEIQDATSPAQILPLIPAFDWMPRKPVCTKEVQFVDCSGGVIRDYLWDFGDGQTSTNKSPSHVYQKPGKYQVVLEIHGPTEEQHRAERSVEIGEHVPLKAAFKVKTEQARAGSKVPFESQCEGLIREFKWDFGDGTSSTRQDAEHVYAKPGEYTVRLEVTGAEGEPVAAEQKVAVGPPLPPLPPNADFIPPLAPICVGQSVQFIERCGGKVDQRSWDFGDGSEKSNEENPVHAFAEPKEYEVTLTVTGPGGSDVASKPVTVLPPRPEADFEYEPKSVRPNEAVQFSDRSEGAIEKRVWDFGDESATSDEKEPTHQYAKPETYTVTLTVEGPGGTDSKSKPIVVKPYEKPKAAIDPGVEIPIAGQEVSFTDDSNGDVASARWDFGDGSPAVEVEYPAKNPDKRVRHTFAKEGTYVVTLSVKGPDGDEDKAEKSITVGPDVPERIPPEARFSVNQREGRESLDVHFTNETTGTVAKYTWDFGDGSAPVVQDSFGDVDHTYGPGTYSPSLTAEGPEKFAVSKYTLEDPIVVKPPKGWWRKHWWKVLLIVAAVGVIAWFGWQAWKRHKEFEALKVLTGAIHCKPVVPADAAWWEFRVSGKGASHTFSPAESLPPDAPAADRDRGLTATLTKSVDPTSYGASYELELHRGDTLEGTVALEPEQDVQQSGYLFRYQA